MTTLFAQPYDITATGFFFRSSAEYDSKAAQTRNDDDQPVEEYEIQFIDGEGIDAALFEALSIHQANIAAFLAAIEEWGEEEKTKVIVTVSGGYSFDLDQDDPERFDVDLYDCASLRDLAMQFVEEGLYGDIPDRIQGYLDYDAIARDLAADYSETEVAGTRYIYRCA